ncbi:hypothetical protein ABZ368_15540 [Streptomyces sp. NPDC005908]|uniref:hypothetical protein n=1 Tax=Streptomyces sp. NPDC005908 TaxID=3157084 RepID=UPI0033E2C8F4
MTDPQRVNIGQQHPAAYKTLIALSAEAEKAAAAAGLDPLLVDPHLPDQRLRILPAYAHARRPQEGREP